MIDGVVITPLRQFLDERGKVMKMLSRDDPTFREFGEMYFSCVFPGAIKAWHTHTRATIHFAVPHGRIKFALFDDREGSRTRGEVQEVVLGPDNYCLLVVPPKVWDGFKGLGGDMAVVAICASITHDPEEIARRDPFDPAIPYDWKIKHR